MSNHFTYEINERNIRMQLKGYTLEAKEEDWQRFSEQFTESTPYSNGTKIAAKFNISLTRNVVLPSVFGLIILIFTLVLVNFINIKNPIQAKEHSLSDADKSLSPQVMATNPSVKNQSEAPQTNKDLLSNSATIPPTSLTVVNQKTTTELKEIPIDAQLKTSSPITVNTPAEPTQTATLESNPVTDANSNDQTKNKRKKRILESVNSESSSDLRPTLVSEDREAEVRPE